MDILYVGDTKHGSTSAQRLAALKRIGVNVTVSDPYIFAASNLSNRIAHAFHYRTGYNFLQPCMHQWFEKLTESINKNNSPKWQPDIVWVNSGELLGKDILDKIKRRCGFLLLDNNDDPTGGRDGYRFNSLLKGLSLYDACVVMRDINKPEYEKLGVRRVLVSSMGYDEQVHAEPDVSTIPNNLQADVAFIGTNIKNEQRDEFLIKMLNKGIDVKIWGDQWQRSKNWNQLKHAWQGYSLQAQNYSSAIRGSKVCLGMLSKGNRDSYTSRSLEIPYAGGLLCAERTEKHSQMYSDGVEAIFWSDVDECIQQCLELLSDNSRRERIRIAGKKRVLELSVGNEDRCREIINWARH